MNSSHCAAAYFAVVIQTHNLLGVTVANMISYRRLDM